MFVLPPPRAGRGGRRTRPGRPRTRTVAGSNVRPPRFHRVFTRCQTRARRGRHAGVMTSPAAPTLPDLPARTRVVHEPDQAAAAREREARSACGVTGLLARRPELRGVLATADWLDEAVRWSA